MRMTESDQLGAEAGERRILAYGRPRNVRGESPQDVLWAALLSLPGLCGFSLLIGALILHSDLAWAIGPRIGIGVWGVAFACAIYSFRYFRGRRKSGWTKFCLALNWLGVIFTVTPPGWLILFLAIAAPR
jgi:hypothetical protein